MMTYSKDELGTLIRTHFNKMREPILLEMLHDYNRAIHKDEIRLAQEKLKLINSEEDSLQNWLDDIGYNSKMSDANKTKVFELLVEAGVDPF